MPGVPDHVIDSSVVVRPWFGEELRVVVLVTKNPAYVNPFHGLRLGGHSPGTRFVS